MKKISIILAVFALAMTMSQCKKNEGQTTSNDEVVTITLDVKQNNGSKVVVNPNTGTVNFETGDKIYVGSGGKYVGFLTHNGTNFSGNITNPTENQPLQFYFLGNVTPQETLSAGTTEECSVIISDQTEHLPVISCAASNENYVSGVTAYSAHLLNKCALVKFNVTTPSNSPICITGMKNKVTVDFAQNTVTPSMDGEGVIKLPAGGGENVEKWAILLPQEALEEGEVGSVFSEDRVYYGVRPTISIINENNYLAEGIFVHINTKQIPVGAINGLFTINENGDKVFFSRGNLQYQATTSTWRFAENQWNYVGGVDHNTGEKYGNTYYNGIKCDNSLISQTYSGWIDLFGWGTSGWNNGNVYYQPYNSEIDHHDNTGYGYGPTDGIDYNFDLTGIYANADWGVYNPISNDGCVLDQWRTLTIQEWQYIINTRSTHTGIRFANALVNGIEGLILLPDNWENSYYSLNNSNWGYNNTISAFDWNEYLEPKGAVFLPDAGERGAYGTVFSNGTDGYYWSSSCSPNDGAYVMETGYSGPYITGVIRCAGVSVRLVQDYQP